ADPEARLRCERAFRVDLCKPSELRSRERVTARLLVNAGDRINGFRRLRAVGVSTPVDTEKPERRRVVVPVPCERPEAEQRSRGDGMTRGGCANLLEHSLAGLTVTESEARASFEPQELRELVRGAEALLGAPYELECPCGLTLGKEQRDL